MLDALKLRYAKEAKTLQKDSIRDEVLKLKLTKLQRFTAMSLLPKDKLDRYGDNVDMWMGCLCTETHGCKYYLKKNVAAYNFVDDHHDEYYQY